MPVAERGSNPLTRAFPGPASAWLHIACLCLCARDSQSSFLARAPEMAVGRWLSLLPADGQGTYAENGQQYAPRMMLRARNVYTFKYSTIYPEL
jgi:hypothetical protein